MSEETAAPQEAAPDTGGLALDLAMEEARDNPALHHHVAAFLNDQRGLIAIQKHHLVQQFALAQWEKRLGVFLRLATLVVGIGVAAALGVMVWQAAHSRGLIIESFTVPPGMAQRGLTGQVLASQVIDKLAAMAARESSRAVQSYANNWGDNIKVEIPETGVSIGELRRFLADWLGHDIRISGEVFSTATGITLTARAGGGDAGASFTGPEADLDSLVQKAAEHVYEITQPYRYANYLDRNYDPVGLQDRVARATAIYNRLIAGDDLKERAWALNGLGTIAFNFHRDDRESTAYYRRANATVPDFTIGVFALASRELLLSRNESALAGFRRAKELLTPNPVPDLNPDYVPNARASTDAYIAEFTGDYLTGIRILKTGLQLPYSFSVLSRNNFHSRIIYQLAYLHDAAGIKAYLRESGFVPAAGLTATILSALEDWPSVRAQEAAVLKDGPRRQNANLTFSATPAALALARAKLGEFARAEALITPTDADCGDCLRVRARIAEVQGQRARADWWFARAVAQSPSLPFGYLDWGRALLDRGEADDAIAKFMLANQKGPKFADPLEYWGEALMAKSQSHLALAKFAEAEKYAPNWGRLHLKLGEALTYAGKKDEARAHFARAAALDLTPSEKSELARHL